MRHPIVVGLVIALSCATVGCSSSLPAPAPTPAPVPAACRNFVLTGHPSYPPVAWRSGATLIGGGIDVVRLLAKASGVPMQVLAESTWAGAQQAVQQGQADAIVGLYKTPQRELSFDYVAPALAPDWSSVVIRAGETFPYKNWNSLIGKRGVVGSGESYGPQFDAFRAAKLTTYTVPTLADVFAQVLAGKAQYGLSGYYTALTSAPKGIAFATKDFATEGLYLAFGKQSPCNAALSAAFSTGITRLKASGAIARIFARELAVYEKTHPRPE